MGGVPPGMIKAPRCIQTSKTMKIHGFETSPESMVFARFFSIMCKNYVFIVKMEGGYPQAMVAAAI